MTTATTTDLRARARAAFHRDVDESAARISREAAEAGRMLATALRERLGLVLDAPPDRGALDHEGIRFWVTHDWDRGYRDSWRSWVLHAAVILPGDEYGSRTSEHWHIEDLAALGRMLEEHESPVEGEARGGGGGLVELLVRRCPEEPVESPHRPIGAIGTPPTDAVPRHLAAAFCFATAGAAIDHTPPPLRTTYFYRTSPSPVAALPAARGSPVYVRPLPNRPPTGRCNRRSSRSPQGYSSQVSPQ
jgi:hypothetical protein